MAAGAVTSFVPVPLSAASSPSATSLAEQDSARAVGYAQGWAAGRRAAAVDRAREAADEAQRARLREQAVESALIAVRRAADQLGATVVARSEELTGLIVDGAIELAAAVLGRELALSCDPGLEAVRRAVAEMPAGRPVVVHLNPGDLAALDTAAATGGAHEVRLVGDPALGRGDAVAVQDDTTVDARVAAALERARTVLQS